MKTAKFTEKQIAFAQRQTETGTPIAEVCRKICISGATFYNWKKIRLVNWPQHSLLPYLRFLKKDSRGE